MDYLVTCKKCGLTEYCNVQFGQIFTYVCPACASFNFAETEYIEFKNLPNEEQVYRLKQCIKGYKE